MTKTILLACSLLAGCVVHHPTVGGDDDDDVPLPPPAPVVEAAGAYQVRSTIDLTVEAVLPEPAEELVVTLREFSQAPAHTLVELADDAGVPAVSELRALLPDILESRLEGWLDDEIAKVRINGVPVTEVAAGAAGLAETALTRFELDSELVIAGGQATHKLTALDFAPAGLDARIAIDADIAATASATSHAGTLRIGDHRYGLAYGDYIWRVTDTMIATQYGAGLRAAIGDAVNCPRIAQTIANKCMFSVCVGHADLVEELCEAGLDEVVGIAHDKVTALRFDVLHFSAGSATLVDHSHDGIADALTGGVWAAELNAGFGLRPVPATFVAAR